MNKENPQCLTMWWILFSLLVWVFAFHGFLSSKFQLISDALSYYDHTKFFIENLGHGIYPLWDPFWCYGAPNDFFLRRIGALNPFYVLILFFKSVGIPYTLSYLWFLGAYYWGGMVAFYLLAMRIYHDRLIAYAGYLILLFSALGTRLFDSYMMLVTVPLIWFFYFLVAFTQTRKKNFFLGIILSLMILSGTYIPFYFLIILGLFLLIFSLIYFNQVPGILRNYAVFFKANKVLVLLSLMTLVFTFLPIITFFHDSSQGQVLLPVRHGDAGLQQTLAVPHQTLDWGAVEDLMYSAFFSDLRQYKFAVVYVPFFSFIVLGLGFIGHLSRRAVFMFLLGMVLFCCIVPHGLPFYDFFYRHLFFLKYFRNLHFFIWFFLIPLFVLLALEHWNMFTEIKLASFQHRFLLLVYVIGVHLAAFLFVWYRQDAVMSTYIMILLSLLFWSLMTLRLQNATAWWGYALLTLTVLIQPLEAYHYFSLKAVPFLNSYNYDFSFRSFELNTVPPEHIPSDKPSLYYVSGGYNFIYQHISNAALAQYLQHKMILVDSIKAVDRQDMNVSLLEQNFLTDANMAFIFKNGGEQAPLKGNDPHPSRKAQPIENNSKGFKLLSFDANHLRILMDVPYEKFLIYNDSDDPYWKVSVNHHRTQLYEVNGAFKGTWIPAGKSVIEFSYGCWWQYAMNILLSIFAFILLGGIIWYGFLP